MSSRLIPEDRTPQYGRHRGTILSLGTSCGASLLSKALLCKTISEGPPHHFSRRVPSSSGSFLRALAGPRRHPCTCIAPDSGPFKQTNTSSPPHFSLLRLTTSQHRPCFCTEHHHSVTDLPDQHTYTSTAHAAVRTTTRSERYLPPLHYHLHKNSTNREQQTRFIRSDTKQFSLRYVPRRLHVPVLGTDIFTDYHPPLPRTQHVLEQRSRCCR